MGLQEDINRMRSMMGLSIISEDTSMSHDQFKEYLKKFETDRLSDRFNDVEITPETFNEYSDEIYKRGDLFFGFGDNGMYASLDDHLMSDGASKILDAYPVIDSFSNFEDYKNSKYYQMTDYLFKPTQKKGDSTKSEGNVAKAFNYGVKQLGDFIVKSPKIENPEPREYRKYGVTGNKLSKEEKYHIIGNIWNLQYGIFGGDMEDFRDDFKNDQEVDRVMNSVLNDLIEPNFMDDVEPIKNVEDGMARLETLPDFKMLKKSADKKVIEDFKNKLMKKLKLYFIANDGSSLIN